MNAAETMIWLSNTAHQREVADLQAAGLNPVLSANSSGAAVPNLSSAGGSSSAKAIAAAARHNPVNKALDIAGEAVSAMQHFATDRLSHTRTPLVETIAPASSGEYSFNQGIPTNALSSYANSMANTIVPLVTGLVTSGIAGPAAGLSSGTVTRIVQSALKPLQRSFRNSAVAVQANQNIHDADYARNLLGRK